MQIMYVGVEKCLQKEKNSNFPIKNFLANFFICFVNNALFSPNGYSVNAVYLLFYENRPIEFSEKPTNKKNSYQFHVYIQ